MLNNIMDNKNSYKKSVKSKLNFVIQYFPPDFAATGQLLNDLTKRLAKLNYKINITTSNSSYANKNCIYLEKE